MISKDRCGHQSHVFSANTCLLVDDFLIWKMRIMSGDFLISYWPEMCNSPQLVTACLFYLKRATSACCLSNKTCQWKHTILRRREVQAKNLKSPFKITCDSQSNNSSGRRFISCLSGEIRLRWVGLIGETMEAKKIPQHRFVCQILLTLFLCRIVLHSARSPSSTLT